MANACPMANPEGQTFLTGSVKLPVAVEVSPAQVKERCLRAPRATRRTRP
jgi:hypothetical protein